jgi:hypothetical protein
MELRYPTSGPLWLRDFGASVVRLLKARLSAPLWLWSAPTAELPATTDLGANEGAILYDETVDRPSYYDGAAWISLMPYTGGAALTRTNDTNVTLTLSGSPSTALLAATSLTLGWTGQLSAARGGTGIASYAVGDILYASGATTLARLADVATGNVLISGGVGAAPSWGKVGISTHVSGLGTGIAAFLATPSSANLAAAITDETGTAGSLVFSVSPAFTGTVTAAAIAASGIVSAASYQVSGTNVVDMNGNFTRHYSPGGVVRMYIGNASDPRNIWTNTTHEIYTAGLGALIATFNANGLAITGTLSTTGLASSAGGFKDTGSVLTRFENGGGSAPAGSTGQGIEITGASAGSSYINAYNRTTSAYAPLIIGGSTVSLQSGGSTIGAISSTGLAVTGLISATTTIAATGAVSSGDRLTLSGSNSFGSALTSTGQLYHSATLGLVIAGAGSTSDLLLTNKSGQTVLQVATGSVAAVFGGTVAAAATSGFLLGTNVLAIQTGGANGYHELRTPTGGTAIHLGGSTDATNYYSNTTHTFRDLAGSTTFATINSTNFSIPIRLLLSDTTTDSATKILVQGTAKGVRIGTSTTGGYVEGVDNTGTGSYQPLTINGSNVTISASASVIATISSAGLGVTGAVTATTFLKSGATTVAGLPAAGTAGAGARHFVTDANATTFASVVAGGGANGVPVYSDGANWRIG